MKLYIMRQPVVSYIFISILSEFIMFVEYFIMTTMIRVNCVLAKENSIEIFRALSKCQESYRDSCRGHRKCYTKFRLTKEEVCGDSAFVKGIFVRELDTCN